MQAQSKVGSFGHQLDSSLVLDRVSTDLLRDRHLVYDTRRSLPVCLPCQPDAL